MSSVKDIFPFWISVEMAKPVNCVNAAAGPFGVDILLKNSVHFLEYRIRVYLR